MRRAEPAAALTAAVLPVLPRQTTLHNPLHSPLQTPRDEALPPLFHLLLFGAGHVGQALVTLLGRLPCVVQWVDVRDEQFPDETPANVQIEATDTPEALVDAAPPGAYFLVMTHDHALDFALAQRILRRGDFAYFGMIGSHTKRVKFERRLLERGVDPARIGAMVCPVGVPGIADKAPASIALAVCAELLCMRSRAHREAGPGLPSLRRMAQPV
ncbi:xanthine dehydrogenase accessory protein XdhC [Paraburkholderia bonniea]|uniref:xanthine dehydrogenase accessory protein XdhC n=1 Tax=Paraburkholderia bonniea TaxID=2152891 RepID=UPI00129187D1|nr:xanthine dehydrogenase accessory protein XdhC [Paraburkholderia bonniea]WJF90880.1 xanthine dehydrogenase accessory protein XdhC [Paraburkholderia bonniea]WJF94195.1 xanthine dehydrogenase accessory protein XdhC [Paraburkholderia bonniea]